MATIWDDKNHSSGEQFILSKSANSQVKKAFNSLTFPCTKIDEKEFMKSKKVHVIFIPENHKPKNNDIIFFFESKDTAYKVIAASTLNNSNFTWSTAGTSTNRSKMTEIKELSSLYCILKKKNTNSLYNTDEELILQVKNEIQDVQDYWKSVYFTSALAHANAIDKLGFTSGIYEGERQQANGGFSKQVYKIAKKLTSKAADNWNPSDLWFINKTNKQKTLKILSDFEKEINVSNLDNFELAYKYKVILDKLLESGDLVGVSLKQVDKGSAKCDLLTYGSIKRKASDMDFNVLDCYIRETKNGLPAYGELRTKSGFNIKWGGRANATKANINLEGQMSGSTHQLGAIDAKVVDLIAKQKGFKIYKDSDFSEKKYDELKSRLKHSIDVVKKHQPNIYKMYFNEKTQDVLLALFGFVEVKRFIANVSVFELINSLSFDEILDFFLLAKKIDKINPNYYILH